MPVNSLPRCSPPRVLVVTAFARDQAFFLDLQHSRDWNVVILPEVTPALDLIAAEQFPVVVCDRDIPGWDWRDILTAMVHRAPGTCFLLTSRVSDEYLWKEVVRHGGYDLLTKPLDVAAVNRTLQRAWYYWKFSSRLGATT